MFGSDKRYLSISINEGTLKVAQVRSSGAVERIARVSLPAGFVADDLAKALKSLLSPFDRKASVVCLVPANVATAKNIEVPSIDPEEIKSIINLQASRHTPYSREEVLISHINLGLSLNNNTRVLLVIAHRDVVKERITVLEKAGLSPDKILFIPEGISFFYAKALNLKKDARTYGIIDVELNATNYLIVAKGALVFARYIPVGIKAMMEGTQAHVKLLDEVNKSVSAFVNEDGNEAPASYLVSTAHEAVRQIVAVLQEGLKVEFSVSPFTAFIKGSGAIKKKLQNEFGDDSFLDVIAPVVAIGKSEINLMPQEMIAKKTVERQSREASWAGVAAVLIMLLVGAIIMSNIYFKDTFLNKNLRARYADQRAQVQALEERMERSKVIREYLKDRLVSLETIHELYVITPTAIYLTSVTLDEDGAITITGISESMSQVFTYVKALDDSPLFAEAKTRSTATKKERGKDVAAFEIVFKLEEIPKEST